jgi:hypothetical protein
VSAHFKRVCRICGKVIAQCRCPGPKALEMGLCDGCATSKPIITEEPMNVTQKYIMAKAWIRQLESRLKHIYGDTEWINANRPSDQDPGEGAKR